MMRTVNIVKTVTLSIFALSLLASAGFAQEDSPGLTSRPATAFKHGKYGIGVLFGEPTGLTGKMWTTENTGFDIGLAWSWSGDGHFHIFADYLFHNWGLFDVDKGALPVYIGLGGRMLFRDDRDDKIGVRLPIGIEYYFDEWPVAVYGEIVPILDLAPETKGDINGGIGIRFYF
jgi:hypothetical protein